MKNGKKSLSQLTLREKIGQTALMQMSWFMNRTDLSEYLSLNPIGNVWHNGNYAMNTANLTNVTGGTLRDSEYYRKWMKELRKLLPVPPFIGLDPLAPGFATNIPEIVKAPAVGATNSDKLAFEYGKIHGQSIKSVGGNFLWAPVVDTPSRFNSVATMRAMSDETEKLCDLSLSMIKGVQEEGVAATAKHFPGYDQCEYRDSHFSPAYNHSTKEQWWEKQGKVFQSMIDGGVCSIMIGHFGFPAFDDSKLGKNYRPATISRKIITELLKEEMGFKGVVVTDAIDMAGLAAAFPDEEDLFVELLNAGNDLLLNVKRYDYIDIIERAVNNGRISEDRIDDACSRILRVKEKLGLFESREEVVMDEALQSRISELNRIISENAITLECDTALKLPLNPDAIHNVAIICSTHREMAFESLVHMKNAFEKRGMNVHLQRRISSYEEIAELDKENDLLIYAGYLAPHAPMGASSFYDEECETFFFAFTKGADKSIGISLGSPYVYYDFYQNSDIFIHLYSMSRESQEAFVKAIFGEIPFKGVMPYIKPGPRTE